MTPKATASAGSIQAAGSLHSLANGLGVNPSPRKAKAAIGNRGKETESEAKTSTISIINQP